MAGLAAKTCVPCRGGVPPLKGAELAALQGQVDGWNVVEEHHITKSFKFPNFRHALEFVDRVGQLAEEQGHHPDIFLAWGKVEITSWTHTINSLTESDFQLRSRPPVSVLAQGGDGLDLRGSTRGNVTSEKRRQHQHGSDSTKRNWIERADAIPHAAH